MSGVAPDGASAEALGSLALRRDRSGEILAARWSIERTRRPAGPDLLWLGYAKPEVLSFICLACGTAGFKQGVLRVEGRTLYLCGACASHQFHPPPAQAATLPAFTRRYRTEYAPDLADAARLAARAVAGRRGGRLLDVGCGIGFAVDIVGGLPGWTADGVDPGPLAKVGADALGLELLTGGADAVARLAATLADAGGFDVVLCEGALDRSPDPLALLRAARATAAADASWLLSTADAAMLYAAADVAAIRRLTAAERVLLPSRIGLHRLLTRAGFAGASVSSANDALRADCGVRTPAADQTPDQAAAETMLDAYLSRRVVSLPRDGSLRLGLLVRALERAVSRGDWAGGKGLAAHLVAALAAAGEAARGAAGPESLEQLLRAAPVCAPSLLYQSGMLQLQGGGPSTQALVCFELCAALARRAHLLAPELMQAEADRHWAARFQAGIVRSRMGEIEAARTVFEALTPGNGTSGADLWATRARAELAALSTARGIEAATPARRTRRSSRAVS